MTRVVDTVQCKLCGTFGLVYKDGGNSKAVSCIKVFYGFTKKCYNQHLLSHHPRKWYEYSHLKVGQ